MAGAPLPVFRPSVTAVQQIAGVTTKIWGACYPFPEGYLHDRIPKLNIFTTVKGSKGEWKAK